MQILLTIAYDGTNYAGWQRQKNAVAIQQRLEEALAEVFPVRPVRPARPVQPAAVLRSASRTDAGVHALGQRASFYIPTLNIPPGKLPQVINARLPDDIAVTRAEQVPDSFNPRFCAVSKTYRYQIITAPNPLLARYSAFVPQELSLEKMRQAARHFFGRHDFAAFCAAGSSAKTTVRTVFECSVDVGDAPLGVPAFRGAPLLQINITGDAFLYNMVRIIAGTLVYAGLGKLAPDEVPDIIASRVRARAGKTMPAKGLTLLEVRYY